MAIFGKAEERRGDLRNASVLEVIVAIIIVLVIFIYDQDKEFASTQAALQAQLDEKSKALEVAEEQNFRLTKENKDLKILIFLLSAISLCIGFPFLFLFLLS